MFSEMTRLDEPRLRGIGISSKFLICKHCGKQCLMPRNRWDTFQFCSRKCLWHWHNENDRVPTACQVCAKGFSVIACRGETAKYCSRGCYYKAMHLKGSVEKPCRHCGTVFRSSPSHQRIYCSRKCVKKAELSVWKPSFTFARKALLARGRLVACEQCGYDAAPEILGVHHKDENRHNNAAENLIVLCPNCHSLAHRQHIPHGHPQFRQASSTRDLNNP